MITQWEKIYCIQLVFLSKGQGMAIKQEPNPGCSKTTGKT